MGGKTKHLQRTKNNTKVRKPMQLALLIIINCTNIITLFNRLLLSRYSLLKPSSSGRSAELLATSTISSSGFANVQEYGFLPTMLQGFSISDNTVSVFDDMDSSIDTNYQMVFRKMTKKDPITKVKALQEFIELVGKTEVVIIKTILPFWPRLYNNLATDVEHRVREAAQQAQAAIINQAGKGIAPYLKQLAPAWITSQYDTYAPAASIASASFQKAFPSHKLQDVFNFCQHEILDYIIKNLTFYTATTLSNPQYVFFFFFCFNLICCVYPLFLFVLQI